MDLDLTGFQTASDLLLVHVNRVTNPVEQYHHLFNGIGMLKKNKEITHKQRC